MLAKISPWSFKAELLWSPCHWSTLFPDKWQRGSFSEDLSPGNIWRIESRLGVGGGIPTLEWQGRPHSTRWSTQNSLSPQRTPSPSAHELPMHLSAERRQGSRKEHVLPHPVSLLMAQAGLSQTCTALSSFLRAKRVLTNQWTVLTAVCVERNILAKRALCSWVEACISSACLPTVCPNLSLSRLKNNPFDAWK